MRFIQLRSAPAQNAGPAPAELDTHGSAPGDVAFGEKNERGILNHGDSSLRHPV